MAILSLPEELLVLILEVFTLPDHDPAHTIRLSQVHQWARYERECLTTLSNVCLASKGLHRLAWPILYRHFTNGPLRRKVDKRERLDPAQFLQTLCTKPEYGLALRSLSITPWVPIGAMDPTILFEALQGDATLVDLFQWRARSFWLGDEDESSASSGEPSSNEALLLDLQRYLTMGLSEAHMAMLLLLCPAIQALDVRPPLGTENSLISRLLKIIFSYMNSEAYQIATLPEPINDFEQEECDYAVARMFGATWSPQKMQKLPVFRNLEKLVLRGSAIPGSGAESLKNLLVALPSLRILSIMGLPGGHPHATNKVASGVRFLQLRWLELGLCELSSSELSIMIECCPNLTGLEVDWNTGFHNVVSHDINHTSKGNWRVRLGEVADAVALHTPKMKSLKLTTAGLQDQQPSPEHPHTIGKALQQLAHLEELQIDHHAIYGPTSSTSRATLAEIIPTSLKILGIGPSAMHAEGLDDHDVDRDFEPTDSWQDRHIADLNHLLQHKSFMKLCRLDLTLGESSTRRHIHKDTLSKHGWEIIHDKPDIWSFRLRNRGRAEVSGPQHVLTDPFRRFSKW